MEKLSGIELNQQIRSGKTTPGGVFEYFKARAKIANLKLNAFVEIYDASAATQGQSKLSGLPIAIKDNICIQGRQITCASKILKGHKAVYDATVIKRLKTAGLNILGTLNMDEFAFGSSTENSCYGPTRNPWDVTRVPGGSSGGSAAAVAARLVPFALGSDTGGSIRQPAAFCGVVGMKPTYGRVSRYGLIAFGSSLDQIGTFTADFADCAELLNIICGHDPADSTSAQVAVPDFAASLSNDLNSLTIGVPQEYFGQGLDQEMRQSILSAKEVFKKKGAKFIDISLPHTEYAVATYYIIGSSEASSNLQRFDGVKYGLRASGNNLLELYTKSRGLGFGDEAKRRVTLGTYSLSSGYYDAYYLRAQKVRRLIKNDFDQAFKQVDLILTPTAPSPAFKFGEKTQDPLAMYLSDIYTISANLAGLPAVSLPCGFSKNNLPLGMQLIAKEFDEASLVRAGHAYQCDTDFHKRVPKL